MLKSALTLFVALTVLSSAAPGPGPAEAAFEVLEAKCNPCHLEDKPRRVFTQENMGQYAGSIYKQVFVKAKMPKGDEVKLTPEESKALRTWLAAIGEAG
ncbi:hypothetical protein [Phaeodactylibacter luteus]|uniref:Cytochrome c n=1 Tax=Phaeodactylibacter luteus TaxID=1564516 RepID=A0A5C6RP63_9BACT|nr:hypothetical protein [Phaeodactylibacter luteus]TXB63182.1 hypothetical protein FRY97_10255 [Phaeodactylibacter luteus]